MRDEPNHLPVNGDMNEIARELRRMAPPALSASFDERVMAEVRRLPRHRSLRRGSGLWSRLTTPRTVTITPLSWGLLAAAVAAFAVLGLARAFDELHEATQWRSSIASVLFPPAKQAVPSQRVQFVLVAPDAKKVAVVGDFNGWDAKHAGYQAQHRGGGVWSVTAPVPVGHHRYSFVVDDSLWVADPTAPRVADNDYGVPNSAIVVEEQK